MTDMTAQRKALFVRGDFLEAVAAAVAASDDVAETGLDDLLVSIKKETEFRNKENADFGLYDDEW